MDIIYTNVLIISILNAGKHLSICNVNIVNSHVLL